MRINPSVRIIAASGIDSGDSKAKSTRAGVKYFLLKPYTAEVLLRLFREVLDSKSFPKSAEPIVPSSALFSANGKSLLSGNPESRSVR